MPIKTKICGVNTTAAASESVRGGANFIGFVFYPPSPRYVTAKKAAEISTHIPPNIINVGVFVNPEDDELDLITNSVSLSMIQLHGSESPERVSEIRTHTGLSVMKAISIETEEDLDQIDNFNLVADWLLFDAKPNRNISSAMPGGNAISFDWNLLKNYSGDLPWMLSGGLNDKNVAEAVKITKAYHVDVSSGVEDVPGSKSQQKIRSFLDATRLL